jgi:drug/metabolite transporter (DMT)-like permease
VNRRRAEAGLLLNTVLWGATFVLVKSALVDISPMLFLALRFSLATVALAALFHAPMRAAFSWKTAAAGALTGTFLFAGFALQTFGLRLTTAPKSAFLTGLTSVMVPLLAAVVYKSKPRISEVAGVLVAVAGLALMTLDGPLGTMQPGDLLTILCAIGFAAHIVTLGHFSEHMRFEVLSVTQVGAAAAWAIVLLLGAEAPRVVWRPAVVWAVLITGLLATAMAFTIQTWAMQYTTSTRTALIYMFEPVVAWITSFWIANVSLSLRAALGAALILLGIVLVELKPLRGALHPSR